MGTDTGVRWCHHTWSPWHGCQKISPGCVFCYACEIDARRGLDVWGPTVPRQVMRDAYWRAPVRWNAAAAAAGERRRVFPSMCDPFEGPDVPARRPDGTLTTLGALWPRWAALIRATPWLDWLLLTKRPEHIPAMLPPDLVGAPNVWLGTSIESRAYAWRRDALVMTPAVVHFISAEPLLEALDLALADIEWLIVGGESKTRGAQVPPALLARIEARALVTYAVVGRERRWVPKPAALRWIRALRDQAVAAGTAFFFKQYGGPRYYSGGHVLDGREWNEVPTPKGG